MAGEKLETVAVLEQPEKPAEIQIGRDFGSFFRKESTPKGNLATAFNLLSGVVVAFSVLAIAYRLFAGLGAPVTNLSQSSPWGLWMGFYIMCGVAFAAGGAVLTFIVSVLGVKKYRPFLRMAVLNNLLTSFFCLVIIVLSFGRWWNIPNVFIGNGFGANSVMFIVIWLFLLTIVPDALQFRPAFAEWIGNTTSRKKAAAVALGATVFSITLSVLQQAGVGALLTMAKGKIHPLWYSEMLPVLFFVSSIYAGISLVILIDTISEKVFSYQVDEEYRNSRFDVMMGFARICGGVMFGYFALSLIVAQFEGDFAFVNSGMGSWWLLEIIGFVAIPGLMFAHGAQKKNIRTIQTAAIIAMAGILLNRYNSVFLAYNWNLPFAERYFPSAIEWIVALAVVFVQVWVFRWIVNRMPVMRKSPQWADKFERD
jgi:Ni/Fe-hydrogenase subunit HybB-like protein